MIKLVIFDLDDTLFPEMEFVKSGFRAVSEVVSQDFGFDSKYVYNLLTEIFEENKKFVFDRLLERLGIYSDDYVNKLLLTYRTHNPKINLHEDAKKILPFLKERFLLGLITDGFHITQRLKVKSLDIEKYFDSIIYTGEKGKEYNKPSIYPFLEMLNKFNVQANEAVYVGDNVEKDFKGPKDLGMLSVRILRDGVYKNAIPHSKDFEPDLVIRSLLELNDILKKYD
jgi:putative hydrolase of the HAD superfamily